MSNIVSPTAVATAEVDISKALRTVQRPLISATLGSYEVGLTSGLMAAALAANTTIWSFRYTGAGLCIVDDVDFEGLGVITALTAGQAVAFGLFVNRAFTVSASGGTAATLTGNNGKLRTSYATTGVGDIRISSTAALTAGTRTPDAQPMGEVVTGLSAAGSSGAHIPLLATPSSNSHPIILANNEGLEIQNRIAFPAAGTWTFGITVRWTEVTSAEWQ